MDASSIVGLVGLLLALAIVVIGNWRRLTGRKDDR